MMIGLRGYIAILGIALLLPGCGDDGDLKTGRIQFESYCAACHRYDGQQMGEAPPLDGSTWVTGPQERLIRIVLHGVRGTMVVDGETYDREMPGFGQVMTDEDVAALVTFARRHFGGSNEQVTAEAVSRIRAANKDRTGYWSVDELLADQ